MLCPGAACRVSISVSLIYGKICLFIITLFVFISFLLAYVFASFGFLTLHIVLKETKCPVTSVSFYGILYVFVTQSLYSLVSLCSVPFNTIVSPYRKCSVSCNI